MSKPHDKRYIHCGSKNCHPFSFRCRCYKCWPISIISGTHYTELICNMTIIDLSTSPTYCCCTTLGKLICCFWLSSLCTSDDGLLQRETLKCIPPNLWPPNSPDLNPVDYQIWGVMRNRVYQTPVQDVTYLRQRLIDTWNDLSPSIVDDAVDEWRKRLQACVNEKSRTFWTLAVIFWVKCRLVVWINWMFY